MAMMIYPVTIAVVLCAFLSQCSAKCDQSSEDKRQNCLSSRSSEANRLYSEAVNSENPDYTSFCNLIQDMAKCMLPIIDQCSSLADKLRDYNGFIQFNSPPTSCGIKDSSGTIFKKCMGAVLAQCQVHVENIAELEKSDEEKGGDLYISTCPAIRKYRDCFETVKDGCNSQILENFENTMRKYRNHKTYDCFPGDHEPIGTCRTESHSLTCMQRYAPEIIVAARLANITHTGSARTCQLIQKFYDCTAIKASGCTKEVTEDDLLDATRLAKNYGCNLDKCSRLWRACLQKYNQQINATGDQKCPLMKEMALCARYAVNNTCPPLVTNTVFNYFKDYLAPCKMAPVIDICDMSKIGQCNLKFAQVLRYIKPRDSEGCNKVRVFIDCLKPLMVDSCPAVIHNIYKGTYVTYQNDPFDCDIDCPMDELDACRVQYIGDKGKVGIAMKSETTKGEYHSTCRYIAAYRSCIAKSSQACMPKSLPEFTKHSDDYKLTGVYQCYKGKWCNLKGVQQCTFSFERDIAVVARMKTRAEHLAFCGHVNVYLRCLREATPSCPDTVRARYTAVSKTYDRPCGLTRPAESTVTPCVGTCGVGMISSLPVLVTMAAGLAFLWKK